MFSYLLNQAAFIDRIGLSVWTEQKPILDQLRDSKDTGIFKPNALYARCLSGKSPLTGNPVRMVYGRVSRLRRVPPIGVYMTSEDIPLTGAQVNETVRLLTPAATRVQPVMAELTFDLTRVSVSKLYRNLLYRARQWSELMDAAGSKTVYIGSPRSAWELRIYDKAVGITRLELILRRRLLFSYGIRQPDSILLLRWIDLQEMFSLRRFSRPKVVAATKGWRDAYWQEMAGDWQFYGQPLQGLRRMLGVRSGDIERVFLRSPLQRTLDTMQKNLLW
jgi:hypothetical protein